MLFTWSFVNGFVWKITWWVKEATVSAGPPKKPGVRVVSCHLLYDICTILSLIVLSKNNSKNKTKKKKNLPTPLPPQQKILHTWRLTGKLHVISFCKSNRIYYQVKTTDRSIMFDYIPPQNPYLRLNAGDWQPRCLIRNTKMAARLLMQSGTNPVLDTAEQGKPRSETNGTYEKGREKEGVRMITD